MSAPPTLLDGNIPVTWRRSQRARRASLRIDPRGGGVVVTLPPRAGRHVGLALLRNHADWVSARLAAMPVPIPFADGATVPLDGAPHRIRHVPGRRAATEARGGEILVGGDAAFLARRVAEFLRAQARVRFSALALAKSARCGVRPSRVGVKDTSSRWGSCSPSRALSFSWRLVMAPPDVQDYVAAHEVAHLRHMNHGPEFWALVAELTPHTERAVRWLRTEGPKLLSIGNAPA